MTKTSARRTYLCKGSREAVASDVGAPRFPSRSSSRMDFKPPSDKDVPRSNGAASPELLSADASSEGLELHPSFRKKLADIDDQRTWTVVQTKGVKAVPRFNHAAALVGRKLVVIGGENGSETRNDVQMLHLGKLSWANIAVGNSAPSKGLSIKSGPAQKLPSCKGHSLIAWGKTVILVAGLMEPPEDKVTVWSFDLEMDCWTAVATKGEIPAARSGQTVTRAGSILIMFGGEDPKGRKLNDLNVLDLKSLMWLPLHPSGKGPSARSRHVADMYDDRFLFIFGGETKSKLSNDTFALDFDNMEWAKLKTKGVPPVPRAGHTGALVGSMWYMAGGESRSPGLPDTTVLDMSKMEWSVVVEAVPGSVASLQGLSLVFVQRKDKRFLVAFGGRGSQASNSVHVLHIPVPEPVPRRTLGGLLLLPTTPDAKATGGDGQLGRSQHLMGSGVPCSCVHVSKGNTLQGTEERRSSSQASTSRSVSDISAEVDSDSGLIPLRTKYRVTKASEPVSRRSSFSSDYRARTGRSSSSQGSCWDPVSSTRRSESGLPKLKEIHLPRVVGSQGCERPHQIALGSTGHHSQSTEITAPSVDSGLMSSQELQMKGRSPHPGLVSSFGGDVGKVLFPADTIIAGKARSRKGSSESSEFSGYAESLGSGETHSNILSVNESTSSGSYRDSAAIVPSPRGSGQGLEFVEQDSHAAFTINPTKSLGAQQPTFCGDRTAERDSMALIKTPPDKDKDELTVLSRIQTASCAEERRYAIGMLRQYYEEKLAAAIRTGELLAGQCADALRDRDRAERAMQAAKHGRQRVEGKLLAVQRQVKDLQERLCATEQAREQTTSLIHNARVENYKLEQDLAVKTAILGESQKELQATRGILIAEGTRAFQLQVELLDLKHKLHGQTPRGILSPCKQQCNPHSILA